MNTDISIVDHNFLNEIHQSLINLEDDTIKEKELLDLTKQLVTYLDLNLIPKVANEILSLIKSCFLHFNEPPQDICGHIMNKSRQNSNYIVLTASIYNKIRHCGFSDKSFFQESFKQIFSQIPKSDDIRLIIFNQEIPRIFESNYILDVILLVVPKWQHLPTFFNYILRHDDISKSKLSLFLKKLTQKGLIVNIPTKLLLTKDFFPNFTMESLSDLIPELSEKDFKQILPYIERTYSKEKKWYQPLLVVIIEKCISFNIKFRLMNRILQNIRPSNMKEEVWNYFAKYNVVLTNELASQIKEFPNPVAALKVMPDVNMIPLDVLERGLLESNDLQVYQRLFDSSDTIDLPKKILSSSQFWAHIVTIVSTTNEGNYSQDLLEQLALKFLFFVPKNKVFETIVEIIQNKFPTSNNENKFLLDFIESFDYDYSNDYNKNMGRLLNEILYKKRIPYPSFWKLIRFKQIKQNHDFDLSNPILLYAHEYSDLKECKTIESVIIYEQTKTSNDELIFQFLIGDKIDNIVNLNYESLSLVMSALYFAQNDNNIEIEGLNEIVILPFLAIAFKYKSKNKFLSLDSPIISNLLFEACNILEDNENILLNTSIDILIDNFNEHCNNMRKNYNNAAVKVLDGVIPLLLADNYKADKMKLLVFIFNLSYQYLYQKNIGYLFDFYGRKLIMYLIQNMHKITNFDKLKDIRLNLEALNHKKISIVIVDLIQTSPSEEIVINTINFIEYYSANLPPLKFTNPSNLLKVFRYTIEMKRWDDVLLLGKIMNIDRLGNQLHNFINETIPFPFKEIIFNPVLFKINNIITKVLADTHPEKNDLAFENLFNLMMTDTSIAMDYFTILFEKISYRQSLDPKIVLVAYHDQYKANSEVFIHSFHRSFSLHHNSDIFIRRSLFQSISSPLSKTGTSLISILFNSVTKNPNNYQAFFCLLSISSSFPFLFTQNPLQVFNIVLPAFNYFSLYFTAENPSEDKMRKIKTAITAMAFLVSSLYSVITLNSFVPWLYKNIMNFSDSQALCFIFILQILFKTHKINRIMLALFKKYNFIKIIEALLYKKVEYDLEQQYKKCIFSFYAKYFNTLNSLSNRHIIYVDELSKIENPFIVAFQNFSTILPNYLLNMPSNENRNNKEISEYISDISKARSYWLNQKFTEKQLRGNVTDFGVGLFILHYTRLFPKNVIKFDFGLPIPYFEIDKKVKFHRYFCHHPKWIRKCICKQNDFPLLPEHVEFISNAIDDLNRLNYLTKKAGDNEKSIDDIKIDDYFSNNYCSDKLLNYLINELLYDGQSFSLICLTFESITKNETLLISFLKIINQNLLEIQNKYDAFENTNIIIDLLLSLSENSYFKKHFIEISGECVIDISLYDGFRNNSSFLSKVSRLFSSINEKIAIPISHLIGFMFLQNDPQIIPDALELCEKIDYKYLKNVIRIIEKLFDDELDQMDPSFLIIKCFIEKLPILAKPREDKLSKFIRKAFVSYSSNDKEETLDFICALYNFLAPKRNENNDLLNEIDFSSSFPDYIYNSSPDSILNHAPIEFKNTHIKFYRVYERYRKVIGNIILEHKDAFYKFKFLSDFPGFLSLEKRIDLFKERINERINTNKSISLNIERSNILLSSFNIMKDIPATNWLQKIKVHFVGEEGIDEGGLTNEWFSLIVKEILNPENDLFIQTKNNNYQPNPLSNEKTNYIKYFKFAGMIIARALIQGINVNAHFTRSFTRQILQQAIKFNDLQDFDEEIYNSLQNLFEIDVDQLGLNFTIDLSEEKTVLLEENGDKLDVTNDNVKKYVSLYTNYHLKKSISQQITAFCDGFNSIIPNEDIRWFLPDELELLICGITEIDIKDLQRNIEYEYPYSADNPVIKMFFNVISKWTNEDLAKLLRFVTGCSQVPVNGFCEYKKRNKPITIAAGGDKKHLCVAHTCFNILDLPEYENEEELNKKLMMSIQESQFGIK